MASRSLNFQFLAVHGPRIEDIAAQAERLVWVDSPACIGKVRALAEVLAAGMAMRLRVHVPGEDQVSVIRKLDGQGALTDEVRELFHAVRRAGNAALHENKGTPADARAQLRNGWHLAVWFHRASGALQFKPAAYAEPPDPSQETRALATQLDAIQKDLARTRAEADAARADVTTARSDADAARQRAEALRGELDDTLTRLGIVGEERAIWESMALETEERLKQTIAEFDTHIATTPYEPDTVVAAARTAGDQVDLSEAETRVFIDEALRAVGWEVDSASLTYVRGARPLKGRARAIAEWPTGDGVADYVLFDGLTAVAVIEAKRKHTDVPGALEQARRYSRAFVVDDPIALPEGAPWDGHRVPVLFATNGRSFLMQLPERSGIHMLDARRPTNVPRVLAGWYSPEGIRNLLMVDVDAAAQRLAAEPTDYLGLRDYQLRAIAAVEKGLAEGRRHCLVAMATGTGKTRMCLGLIYRLVKAKRFRRVLFLVDRTALGQQTLDVITSTKLEGLRTFAESYDLKGLADQDPETDTRLHVATVQGMIRRILFAESVDEVPPVDRYDCVIVDECHRGYALDRDMTDAEMGFRDERDYLSKYRRVLDHFDAVRIGLTATPALHTTDIFGRPIFEYAYRDAVLDGWLVDHDVPYAIRTKLSTGGIHWGVGENVQRYDRSTQTLDLATLDDEVHLEVDDFHKKVITESFNAVVCEVLAARIDPAQPGKTLVFCVDDAHADMVVRLLTAAFVAARGPVDAGTVQKITGRTDRPLDKIRHYRNEALPKVAVTVDLLTTGIDVPPITNLVFLRRVRSRILYEQMLGRATRPCPDIGKSLFSIYDAVDLYAALDPVCSMKPVVANPTFRFEQLARELAELPDGEARDLVLQQLIAKLQRRRRSLADTALAALTERAGMEAPSLASHLRTLSPAEAAAWLAEHPGVVRVLDEGATVGMTLYVSEHVDEVVSQGQELGRSRPDDYLDEFGAFVDAQVNRMPALKAVLQRPRDLTREGLKAVRQALDDAGFSETRLRAAWRMKTSEDIAATIVGYIRQRALGDPLVAYSERVDKALAKVVTSHTWTDEQRRWLDRIGAQMKAEVVVDRASLDRGAFQTFGGAARAEKVFEGHVDDVLGDMADAVWERAG